MKRFRLLSVLFVLFSAMSFMSCDTEPVDPALNNNNGEEPGPGASVFKVDFSGQTHTGSGVVATIGTELIQIAAVLGPDGESIAIGIDGATTGTYSSDKLLMGYDPGNDSEETYNNFTLDQESGTVTITSINTTNHTMSGTFSFTGWYGDEAANKPAIVFTNGVFENIAYTGTGGPGPNPEEDSFKAKINGTLHDYSSDVIAAVAGAGGSETISINTFGDQSIRLYMNSGITAGTYVFSNNISDGRGADFKDTDGTVYDISGGSLTIISNTNDTIKGTFFFTVKNDAGETIHTVTEGTFNVGY